MLVTGFGERSGARPCLCDRVVDLCTRESGNAGIIAACDQYLAAGAKLVWVVYPKTRKVQVFAPGRPTVTLTENDSLEAPELLPGWSLKVSEIFASK